jgi:aminoglycoside 3-N-acetyltransferase
MSFFRWKESKRVVRGWLRRLRRLRSGDVVRVPCGRVVRGWLKRLRGAYTQWRCAFNQDDFLAMLRRLGVKSGDVLLVHSAFDRFEGFTGKATEVIHALQEAVGPGGTILMPTLPFGGMAVDYVSKGRVFDVLRTPSSMGLLTELFRRSAGVVRSVHPTHPVAAWGAVARAIVAGHHLAQTPCGVGTPFARLLDYKGKILFLGTGIEAMTFFHTIEEILEPQMPFTPFTRETYSLHSKDKDGSLLSSTTRLFDPEWSRRRNLEKLVPILKRHGVWKQERVGGLDAVLLDAKEVLQSCQALAQSGVYCYDA